MSAIGSVQGKAAHAAAAVGNPVRVGGVYHSSPPAEADGDVVDILTDAAGRVLLGATTNAIGKLAANSGVDIGDVDVTSLPASTNTIEIVGDVAHDAAVGGNPVLTAGRAMTALPTAVADGDAAYMGVDKYQRQIIYPYAPPDVVSYGNSGAITNTTPTNVIATDSGASLKWYICSITVINSHASVGTVVTIEDDDGNDVHVGYAHYNGGGYAQTFIPPLPTTSADCHIHATCGTTGANVYVFVGAFKAP